MTDLKPTERELNALKVLWKRKAATVREVWSDFAAAEPELPYTTVLSLMQVMQKKGLIDYRVEGRAYRYFAKVRQERIFRELAGSFLQRVFDGAVDQYLVHALESHAPTAEEIERLEQMIAAAKARPQQRTKKRGTRK